MRHSTYGRRRRVTDALIREILAWAERRETLKAFARRIGLSPTTVSWVIRTRGTQYKMPSPEASTSSDEQ